MEIEKFNEFFEKELKKNHIEIDNKKYKLFYDYMNGILEWNNKINVTSITEEKMFIVKHFVDSLTVCGLLKDEKSIIDIGTGAGFPGIPIKFARDQIKITLVDSVNKKLNVIRDVVSQMNIDDLEIIHSRAEDLARKNNYRESYDVAVTRAVSNLSTILEYMLPFVKMNGIAICMKGPNFEEELKESQNAIEILGGKFEKIERINVDNEIERNLIVIRKIIKTPNKYPRNNGKPLKEPIR